VTPNAKPLPALLLERLGRLGVRRQRFGVRRHIDQCRLRRDVDNADRHARRLRAAGLP